MNKRLLFIISLPIILIGNVISQENDAGVWINVSLEKKFTQSWSAEFSHCSRFNENVNELGSIINELGVNYRFNKKSQISIFYRINSQRQLNNMYIPVRRFYMDYSYKLKPGAFVVSIRLRFQHQQKNTYLFDAESNSTYALRPKISFKYPIGKFSPFVSGEAYLPVFRNKYKPIDKIRVEAGLDYEFNKSHSLELSYFIQHEFFTKNARTDFVLSVGYAFSF